MQVHGKKAVVNFRMYPDDVVREPKGRGVSSSSADTSLPSLGVTPACHAARLACLSSSPPSSTLLTRPLSISGDTIPRRGANVHDVTCWSLLFFHALQRKGNIMRFYPFELK